MIGVAMASQEVNISKEVEVVVAAAAEDTIIVEVEAVTRKIDIDLYISKFHIEG